MKRSGFRHSGEVVALDSGDVITISLSKIAACEGCRAKSQCRTNGEQHREMKVVDSVASELEVGDFVDVGITYKVGMIAVVVTYVIPLVVFVATLAIAVGVGVNEGVSALLGFAFTAIYYGVVYLMRERFEGVVEFRVVKSNKNNTL